MESSPAGLTVLALAVLWLGFWVPHRLRHRQQLLDSRIGDRFSGGLQVLAVAGAPAGGIERSALPSGSVPLLAAVQSNDVEGGKPGMVQQSGTRARRPTTGAPPPAQASRLAYLERRAARARRRLLLTLLLILATAVGWALVALGLVGWYAGAVPTGLLLLVLVLGRLAVVSARRADARWAAERRAERQQATQARALANGGPYAPRNRARVTGHAVHASATHTQMIPRVRLDGDGRAEPEVPRESRTPVVDLTEPELVEPRIVAVVESPTSPVADSAPGVGGEAWDPVPVPLPTYVTKAEAPRREPQPLSGTTPAVGMASKPSSASAHDGRRGDAGDRTHAEGATYGGTEQEDLLGIEAPRSRTETLGLPLEQILARRRAAG